METKQQNQEEETIIEFIAYIEKIQQLAEAGKNTFFYADQLQKLSNYAFNKRHKFVDFYELPAASKFSDEKAALYKYIPILHHRYNMDMDSGIAGCFFALSLIAFFAGVIFLFKLKFFLTGILFSTILLFWTILFLVRHLVARHRLIRIETFTNKFYFELEHLKYYGDGNLQIPLDDLDPEAIKITPPLGPEENGKDA